MKSVECSRGRVFVLRLSTDDDIQVSIESFCLSAGISSATVNAIGGAQAGSEIVCGPKMPLGDPMEVNTFVLPFPYEFLGTGTIFLNSEGRPTMHMHASFGRDGKAVTGCIRHGVKVWLVAEVVISELKGCECRRVLDKTSGLELLNVARE